MKGLIITVSLFFSLTLTGQNCIVAEYLFSGNLLNTASNSMHGSAVGNPFFTTDRAGNPYSACYFDGVDDMVEVLHDNAVNFDYNQDFSISLWVKPEANQSWTSANGNLIMSKFSDNGSSNPDGFPFSIRRYNQNTSKDGGFYVLRKDSTICSQKPTMESPSYTSNFFHHILYVKSGKLLKLYVDTILVDTTMDYTSCSTKNNFNMRFGGKGGSYAPSFFKGIIDDIVIFNCAVNKNTMDSLYTAQIIDTPSTNCLVAQYLFSGNAKDSSGNKLHGLEEGGPVYVNDRFGRAGRAMYFDGIDDDVEVSHDNKLNFEYHEDFTISLWVKSKLNQLDTTASSNILISKFDDNGTSNPDGFPYSIRRYNQTGGANNGTFFSLRKDKLVCNRKPRTDAPSPNLDTNYHHVVYQKEGLMLRLFVDNIAVDSVQDDTYCTTLNFFNFRIAAKGGIYSPSHFRGVIDDVMIFNCALDKKSIDSLYSDTIISGPIDTTIGINDPCSGWTNSVPCDYTWKIWPNPAHQVLNLKHHGLNEVDYRLFNVQGEVVLQGVIRNDLESIRVEHLPTGLYNLVISKGDLIETKKVLIH